MQGTYDCKFNVRRKVAVLYVSREDDDAQRRELEYYKAWVEPIWKQLGLTILYFPQDFVDHFTADVFSALTSALDWAPKSWKSHQGLKALADKQPEQSVDNRLQLEDRHHPQERQDSARASPLRASSLDCLNSSNGC